MRFARLSAELKMDAMSSQAEPSRNDSMPELTEGNVIAAIRLSSITTSIISMRVKPAGAAPAA